MAHCIYSINRFRVAVPGWARDRTEAFLSDDIMNLHRLLPGYKPTPLVSLPALAKILGVGEIWVKDESYRFDLQAFKIMGASYAIYRFMKREWERCSTEPFDIRRIIGEGSEGSWAGRYTLCTATDGNHGRAVAWMARRLSQQAVIYMPKGTVPARIQNIENEGARVEIVDGTYDEAVCRAAEDAERNGWQVISDTAYSGYTVIPEYIMAGYTTMFREMEPTVHPENTPAVDVVILQGGVGSFTASAAWYYADRYGENRPELITVEPTEAACLLESISSASGAITPCTGSFRTIMAGLNCGIPSLLAWPFIKDGVDLFVAITDDYAIDAMRRYYHPYGDDPHIVSGESGAAGLGALLALMSDDSLGEAREKIGLGPRSRILLFNTEGATDPEHFRRVVGAGA